MGHLLRFVLLTSIFQTALGQSDAQDDKIICVFEPQPAFPGGLVSLKKFIKRNLRYPTEMRGCEGVVFVGFIVNADGSMTDIEIVKVPCDGFDKILLDLFKKMPKWIPAREDNKAIRTRMILPIKFGT